MYKNGQRVRITDNQNDLESIDLPIEFAGQIVTLEDRNKPEGHLHFTLENCYWYIEGWMVEPVEQQMFFQFGAEHV
jgi:hypothetical protein